MHPIVFLPMFIAILIAINACKAAKGSIVILEETNGTGLTMDLKEWNSQDKRELSLKAETGRNRNWQYLVDRTGPKGYSEIEV